jgi:hypothetical protein
MLKNDFNRLLSIDERFIVHRYYPTRWAMLVGVLAKAGGLSYDLFVNELLRYDLIAVLTAVAMTKIVAMVHYRLTQ